METRQTQAGLCTIDPEGIVLEGQWKHTKGSAGKKRIGAPATDDKNKPTEERALDFIKKNSPEDYNIWLLAYKKRIKGFDKFVADFNDTFDIEGLPYSSKVIFARLDKYACNWISRQDRCYRSNAGDIEPPYMNIKIS